jgi:adenosylhomocysteine nucleosidase
MYEKIGIVCATQTECKPYLPLLEGGVRTRKMGLTLYEGSMNDHDVVVVCSGICKVNAAVGTQTLIDAAHVDAVINSGTAGSMDDRLGLFDIAVADHAGYHDVDAEFMSDEHLTLTDEWFASDPVLLKAAERAAEDTDRTVAFGLMLSGETFIEGDARDAIYEKFHPLCVDMETGAMAHVCHQAGIPFISVRGITDTPEDPGFAVYMKNRVPAAQAACDFVQNLLEELDEVEL